MKLSFILTLTGILYKFYEQFLNWYNEGDEEELEGSALKVILNQYEDQRKIPIHNFITGSPLIRHVNNNTLIGELGYPHLDNMDTTDKFRRIMSIDLNKAGVYIRNIELTEPPYDKKYNYNYLHPDTVIHAEIIPTGKMKESLTELFEEGKISMRPRGIINGSGETDIITWDIIAN